MQEEELKLDIRYFDVLTSTQTYLIDGLKAKTLQTPIAIICNKQTEGIGSRDNSWVAQEGNFFASFAVHIDTLPEDLPLASSSLYFSWIMKKILNDLAEAVWLKWPNDFYILDKKVGGTITKKIDNVLVCGIGINLKNSKSGYKALQNDIEASYLLGMYIDALEKFPKWKQVFSEYQVEFESSKKFSVHIENEKKSLKDAILCDDGSLMIERKKVFSLR